MIDKLEGSTLGVELGQLAEVGRVQLPRMAENYLTINGHVGGTSDGDDAAFTRPSSGDPSRVGTTSMGQIYPHWSALRDRMTAILGNTASNLDQAGSTILNIMDAYSTEDTAAADRLKVEWDNRTPDEGDPKDYPPGEAEGDSDSDVIDDDGNLKDPQMPDYVDWPPEDQ